MQDSRSQSPVVSSILLVAVVVILAATVSVLALGLVDESEPPPQHSMSFQPYNHDHGVISGDFQGGDNIDTERLEVRGGAVDLEFSGFTATAGTGSFGYARPGDTLRYVWEDDTGKTHTIDKYDVPESATLEHVDWDGSQSGAAGFNEQFWDHRDTGGDVQWEKRSDHIRPTGDKGDFLLRSRTVPENDGEVTIDLHLETRSLNQAGYYILVQGQSGDVERVWCDGLYCNAGTPGINGSESKTVSMDEEIGALRIGVEFGNTNEEIRFYDLEVRD
jgi:flagellin-like protein